MSQPDPLYDADEFRERMQGGAEEESRQRNEEEFQSIIQQLSAYDDSVWPHGISSQLGSMPQYTSEVDKDQSVTLDQPTGAPVVDNILSIEHLDDTNAKRIRGDAGVDDGNSAEIEGGNDGNYGENEGGNDGNYGAGGGGNDGNYGAGGGGNDDDENGNNRNVPQVTNLWMQDILLKQLFPVMRTASMPKELIRMQQIWTTEYFKGLLEKVLGNLSPKQLNNLNALEKIVRTICFKLLTGNLETMTGLYSHYDILQNLTTPQFSNFPAPRFSAEASPNSVAEVCITSINRGDLVLNQLQQRWVYDDVPSKSYAFFNVTNVSHVVTSHDVQEHTTTLGIETFIRSITDISKFAIIEVQCRFPFSLQLLSGDTRIHNGDRFLNLPEENIDTTRVLRVIRRESAAMELTELFPTDVALPMAGNSSRYSITIILLYPILVPALYIRAHTDNPFVLYQILPPIVSDVAYTRYNRLNEILLVKHDMLQYAYSSFTIPKIRPQRTKYINVYNIFWYIMFVISKNAHAGVAVDFLPDFLQMISLPQFNDINQLCQLWYKLQNNYGMDVILNDPHANQYKKLHMDAAKRKKANQTGQTVDPTDGVVIGGSGTQN